MGLNILPYLKSTGKYIRITSDKWGTKTRTEVAINNIRYEIKTGVLRGLNAQSNKYYNCIVFIDPSFLDSLPVPKEIKNSDKFELTDFTGKEYGIIQHEIKRMDTPVGYIKLFLE